MLFSRRHHISLWAGGRLETSRRRDGFLVRLASEASVDASQVPPVTGKGRLDGGQEQGEARAVHHISLDLEGQPPGINVISQGVRPSYARRSESAVQKGTGLNRPTVRDTGMPPRPCSVLYSERAAPSMKMGGGPGGRMDDFRTTPIRRRFLHTARAHRGHDA